MWRSRSETSRNRSRRGTWQNRQTCGGIEDRTAGGSAESEQLGGFEPIEEALELHGLGLTVRPADAQAGAEPGEGRADESGANEIAPAVEGAIRDRLLTLAAKEQPLTGGGDSLAEEMTDALHDRTHRRPAPPKLCRTTGCCRAVAEDDADDRQVLERLAGRKVGHPFAVPDRVTTGAVRRPTTGTADPRFPRQLTHVVAIAFDRGDVDGECPREYTDRQACAARRLLHRSRPHVSVAGLSYVFVCEPRSLARNTIFVRSV